MNSLVVKMTNAILLKRREELRISKVGFEYYVIDSGVVQLMREPRAEGADSSIPINSSSVAVFLFVLFVKGSWHAL